LKYLNNIFRAQRRKTMAPRLVSGARAALVKFLSAALAVGVITTPAIAASVPSPIAAAVSGPGAAPTSLTVGQLDSPVDVESLAAPLLGWQVGAGTQSAYQVQVATSSGSLSGTPDVWDSAKFTSSKNASVTYAGPTLTSSSGYYWRVRTWDAADTASAWSAVSHFGTGPGSTWAGASPIWLPSSQGWTDYTFEGTFKIQAKYASVTFRAKDTSNFYMWQFRGNGENTLAPHTNVGGTFTQLKTVALPFALVTGTVYKFRISIQGPTITTYLNDVLVDTTTSSTFTSGGVGFRTGSTEQAYYDDLLVTDPSGTVLYSNDFSTASTDFSCGSIVSGQLFVDKSKNCVTGAPASTSWAFLRGDVTLQPGKDIAWAHVYATGASAEPGRQFVYKLSVNGSFVGVGPTRSIGSETRYDGYDVTSLLHSRAQNTLGALAYTTSGQRFLAQLVVRYTDGTTQTFGTGSTWQTLPAESTSTVLPNVGSVGTSYYSAPKENFNAQSYPFGFDSPGFDGSAWKPAEAKSDFASLVATPTAKVQQQLHTPVSVVEKSPGNYFIDYGRTWVGGLSLNVTGTAGQVLDIRYGEVTSAAQTVKYATSGGNSYQDKWTLKAGPQHLETWGMRVFRYVEVLGAPTGLTAASFPAEAYVYPYDAAAGVFDSSDTNLNQVWQLSKNSIEALNGNLYVDSWERERGAYEADSYLQMMSNFYTSSDPTLGNYSIAYLLKGRTWPTEWPMYIILAMHDSYQQTGDVAALTTNYAALKSKLPTKWFEASSGLIRKTTGSSGAGSCNDCDIVDWPSTERDGYVFTQYNTVINAISYRSYTDMAQIATATGNAADAADFLAKANAIKTAVNARMWDATTGAYRDGLNSDGSVVNHEAVQASVFATAFGLADDSQAAAVASYIGTRGMVCSVYCAAFLLEALYNGGRGDIAYSLLTSTGQRSWMNMISAGAGATMEAWDLSLKSNTTYSHPWAASPAYNVPQGMFGIRPTTPGYDTFDIKPQPNSVTWAHVTVPTLKGQIGAAFDTVSGGIDNGVYVPANSAARVYVPGATVGDASIYMDGKSTAAAYDSGYLRVDNVPPGCHVFSKQSGTAAGLDTRLTGICPGGYKADQSISFGALDAKTFGDSHFTVVATAWSGLPVAFTAAGVCTVTDATVHLTGAGQCAITASQPGSDNFNAAPDVSQSFTVGTPVLDSFNRADGTVGTSWTNRTNRTGGSDTSFYGIHDNALDVHAGGPLVFSTVFGTTQEASVKLTVIDTKSPSQGVLLKTQAGRIPTSGTISVVYDAEAGAVTVSTLRDGAITWTPYVSRAVTFVNGDVLTGRALVGGDVLVYRNGVLVATVALDEADMAFFNAKGGQIGIWTNAASKAVLDDFGGGTIG